MLLILIILLSDSASIRLKKIKNKCGEESKEEKGNKRKRELNEVKSVLVIDIVVYSACGTFSPLTCLLTFFAFHTSFELQIVEACIVSLLTSVISFGLPLLRKCSPCPESDPSSGIECPRPPGMYGNYVNVRPLVLFVSLLYFIFIAHLFLLFL